MKKIFALFVGLFFAAQLSATALDSVLNSAALGDVVDTVLSTVGPKAEYGPSGCGWGSMLFAGKKGTANNVMAATTNGFLGNQTFGMSSGTNGCDVTDETAVNPMLKVSKKQLFYIAANMEKLMEQMSTGQGDFLTAYGDILGCSAPDVFSKTTQANFDQIFGNGKDAKSVLNNTKFLIQSDKKLAASCATI